MGIERQGRFGVDESIVVTEELCVKGLGDIHEGYIVLRVGRERMTRRRTLTRVVARADSKNARNLPPFPSLTFSPTH